MPSSSAFAPIALVYDLLLSEARIARERPALEDFLGDALRVCDLGCGTGRHLASLAADRALQGVGIDADPSMIAAARARAQPEGLRFLVGDLRDPPCPNVQRLWCLGNVLSCLPADTDWAQVAHRWHRLLEPDGKILLQYRLPPVGGAPESVLRRDGDAVLVKTLSPVNEAEALLDLCLHRRLDGAWQHDLSTVVLHRWPAQDLAGALARSGFEQIRIARDLGGTPRRHEDPEVVISAQRR